MKEKIVIEQIFIDYMKCLKNEDREICDKIYRILHKKSGEGKISTHKKIV